MAITRLNIIEAHPTDEMSSSQGSSFASRLVREKELQANFERLWLEDPEQFNPLRNCMQKERIERTWSILRQDLDLKDKEIVDIGCAAGVFSRRLRDAGARVVAADIAENALKHLKEHDMHHIEARRETMPMTTLPGGHYDAVICTEVIAYLYPEDFRLFFSELARLVKSDGYVVCSTAIDIYSDGAVQRFIELAQTELDIIRSIPSYHALYLRLKRACETPNHLVASWKNPQLRQKELSIRSGLNRGWFLLNTTWLMIGIWYFLSLLMKPILALLKNNTKVLLQLEHLCQFLWDERGISHFIILAKRRSLFKEPQELPIERPKRKEIWE